MRPLFIGSYPHGALRMDLRTGTKEPRRRFGCSLPSWGITHKGQYLDKLFVQALVLVNHVGCDHNRGPLSRCDTQADAQSEYYQTPSDWYELNVAQVRRFQEAHSISFKRGAKEGSGGIERITLKDPLCFPFWAGESPQLVDEHGGFVDVQSQLDNWGFSGRIDDVLAILLPEPLASSIQNSGARKLLMLTRWHRAASLVTGGRATALRLQSRPLPTWPPEDSLSWDNVGKHSIVTVDAAKQKQKMEQ